VSAVNSPEVPSGVPEDPVSESEDVVSAGGVSMGGSDAFGSVDDVVELSGEAELLMSVFVEVSVGSLVGSLDGSLELDGSLVESPVESSVVSSAVSSVVSSVVSVDVELSGGVKPLASVVLDDGGVSVEFDISVELVISVQLKIEVMLERSVLFMSVGNWLAGIRQVVVVVLTPDVTFEMYVESVRLVLYAPAVTLEITDESVVVLL
jgi:hypothetical protein